MPAIFVKPAFDTAPDSDGVPLAAIDMIVGGASPNELKVWSEFGPPGRANLVPAATPAAPGGFGVTTTIGDIREWVARVNAG